MEDIELDVEFSRNPFHSWCFQCYADGLGQTDRLTDVFVIRFFSLICWTAVVINKCFVFLELQLGEYFTEELIMIKDFLKDFSNTVAKTLH